MENYTGTSPAQRNDKIGLSGTLAWGMNKLILVTNLVIDAEG